jgi:hypothetical protein
MDRTRERGRGRLGRRLSLEPLVLEDRTLLSGTPSLSDVLQVYDNAVQTIANDSNMIGTIIDGAQGVFGATPSLLGDNLGDLLNLGDSFETPFQTQLSGPTGVQ